MQTKYEVEAQRGQAIRMKSPTRGTARMIMGIALPLLSVFVIHVHAQDEYGVTADPQSFLQPIGIIVSSHLSANVPATTDGLKEGESVSTRTVTWDASSDYAICWIEPAENTDLLEVDLKAVCDQPCISLITPYCNVVWEGDLGSVISASYSTTVTLTAWAISITDIYYLKLGTTATLAAYVLPEELGYGIRWTCDTQRSIFVQDDQLYATLDGTTVTIKGIGVSSNLGDACSVAQAISGGQPVANMSATTTYTVYNLDLDWEGMTDEAGELREDSPGAFVAIGQSLQLYPLYSGPSTSAIVTMSAPEGGEKICVLDNGTTVDLPKVWHLDVEPYPGTLTVQSLASSSSTRDIVLRLECAIAGQALSSDEVKLTVVSLDRVEIFAEGAWCDVCSSNIVVIRRSEFDFRALKSPADAEWPLGKPQWSGVANATTDHITVLFDMTGTQTLVAECGNMTTVTIQVVDFANILYKRSTEPEDYFTTQGGGVDGHVLVNASFDYICTFTAPLQPLQISWEVYDSDTSDTVLARGRGIRCSYASDQYHLLKVIFYFDKDWDAIMDTEETVRKHLDTVAHDRNFHCIQGVIVPTDMISTTPILIISNDITAKLTSASELLLIRNHRDEFRSLCDLSCTGSITTMTILYDIRTTEEVVQVFDSIPSKTIVYVYNIRNGNGWARASEQKIMVCDRTNFVDYAHENGHIMGLSDIHNHIPGNENIPLSPLPPNWSWIQSLLMYHEMDRPGLGYCTHNDALQFEINQPYN